MDLRTSRALELLKTLEQSVAEFATKEEHLARDLKARRFATERKFHEGVEKTDERIESIRAQIVASFEEREKKARATHAARLARIKKFQTQGTRDLPKLAQEARERFLGGIQVKKFKAERDYTTGVQRAEAAYAKSSGDQSAKLQELETRAIKAFGGYQSLLRLLRRKRRARADTGDAEDLDGLFDQGTAHIASAEAGLAEFEQLPVPRFFSSYPPGMMTLLLAVVGLLAAMVMKMSPLGIGMGVVVFAVLLLVMIIIHQSGLGKGRGIARTLAGDIAEGKRIFAGISTNATAMRDSELASLKQKHDSIVEELNAKWERADTVEEDFKKAV